MKKCGHLFCRTASTVALLIGRATMFFATHIRGSEPDLPHSPYHAQYCSSAETKTQHSVRRRPNASGRLILYSRDVRGIQREGRNCAPPRITVAARCPAVARIGLEASRRCYYREINVINTTLRQRTSSNEATSRTPVPFPRPHNKFFHALNARYYASFILAAVRI